MSSSNPREKNVTAAIGDLLHDEWVAANTAGYDPNAPEGTHEHINIAPTGYSEDNPVPHIELREVSEIPEGSMGYSAIKATGAGPIQTFMGRLDLKTYVGKEGDLPENPKSLAKTIGEEVRSIIHDTTAECGGVMDPATGELLATDLSSSAPRAGEDPDLPGPVHLARQEISYERSEDPPNR